MNAMTQVQAQGMVWLLVRIKRDQAGGIRTTTVGGEFEAYKDRAGRVRKRRISGTGKRVFVPEHLLRRAGFEVFLPVEKVLRSRNRFKPEKVYVTKPLIADWLFVGWPAGQHRWQDLMDMNVVMGAAGTGGKPIIMSSATVIGLMRRWGGGVLSPTCHQLAKNNHSFEIGDWAKVDTGPWEGFCAKIIGLEGSTARMIIQMFGRDLPAEFSTCGISPTSPPKC